MAESIRRPGLAEFAWLAFCGCFSSILVVAGSNRLSGTFDEAFYLRAGLTHWRTGSTFELMRYGTMPFPVDMATAPLFVAECVRGSEWNLDRDFDRALSIARLSSLPFWWLVLLAGHRLAWDLGGAWAGRLAVLLMSLEPNMLAHAGLATTDVAHLAFLMLFCVAYRAGRDGNWRSRVLLPGLAAGLALLSKASAMAFVPICILAIEAERTRSKGVSIWRGLIARRFRWECCAVGAIALALTYLYCGSDWQTHPKFIESARALPDGPGRSVSIWFAEHLAIFNNAGVGLCYQIQHNMRAHGAYLLGESTATSFWHYYPVALSMKLSMPLLILAAASTVVARLRMRTWLGPATLVLFAFSLNCRVQIGVRLQLPLIALLCIWISVVISRSLAESSPRSRILKLLTLSVLVVAMFLTTVRSWPHLLSYSNGIWGDPSRGELLLSDSNFDWGQGLKELERWRSDHGEREISIWYFGTDPAALRSPFRYAPLHDWEPRDVAELRRRAPTRYLAVSATIVFGSYVKEPDWLLARLRQTEPAARTTTFLIVDLADLESGFGSPGSTANRTAPPSGSKPKSATPTTR